MDLHLLEVSLGSREQEAQVVQEDLEDHRDSRGEVDRPVEDRRLDLGDRPGSEEDHHRASSHRRAFSLHLEDEGSHLQASLGDSKKWMRVAIVEIGTGRL